MHIGQRIKEVMKAKKISAVKVAKEISCERTNLYNIFDREDINTSLLRLLERTDFFITFAPTNRIQTPA